MRQGLGPTAWMFLFAVGVGALPAAAQVEGTAPSTGSMPDSLPSLPPSGYGVGGALSPANAVNPDLVQALPAPSTRLGAPGAGVAALQQADPRAPAYLIRPRITVSETLTDNARQTPFNRTADFVTEVSPGLSISADTPRLQGVLTGSLDYTKFAFATDQDRHTLSLYNRNFITAIPDLLFVDVKGNVSQASQLSGVGFASVSQLPKASLTPIITASASPYLRKSYYGLIDSELRYRYSTTSSGGGLIGSALAISPTLRNQTAFGDTTTNEGTLTIATGRDFERLLSRLTIDAQKSESTSVAANSRVTAYDDLEYRFAPSVAAIGRLGYENIHYALAPAATTVGIAWQFGGRLNFGSDTDYATFRYGKQQGIYGFSGEAHYQITPATVLTAEASQGLGSQQDQISNTLNNSSLDLAGGAIVDQYGLPTAFVNPAFGIQNDVSRSKSYRINVTSTIGVNHLSLFGTYDRRSSLTSSAPPSTSVGVHASLAREIRPDLTGNLSAGFSTVKNATVTTVSTAANPSTSTLIPSTNTITANLSLNYLFNETLTGSVAYSLIYQTGGPSISNANVVTVGNILTNRLVFALNKTF
jgi:uncharacterized protein (PEP-CTERM system associated)